VFAKVGVNSCGCHMSSDLLPLFFYYIKLHYFEMIISKWICLQYDFKSFWVWLTFSSSQLASVLDDG